MRETAVESHPFGFARGFGKTGQALFAKSAKRMERPAQKEKAHPNPRCALVKVRN